MSIKLTTKQYKTLAIWCIENLSGHIVYLSSFPTTAALFTQRLWYSLYLAHKRNPNIFYFEKYEDFVAFLEDLFDKTKFSMITKHAYKYHVNQPAPPLFTLDTNFYTFLIQRQFWPFNHTFYGMDKPSVYPTLDYIYLWFFNLGFNSLDHLFDVKNYDLPKEES